MRGISAVSRPLHSLSLSASDLRGRHPFWVKSHLRLRAVNSLARSLCWVERCPGDLRGQREQGSHRGAGYRLLTWGFVVERWSWSCSSSLLLPPRPGRLGHGLGPSLVDAGHPYGLGVAWGADLKPSSSAEVALCTPDKINEAVRQIVA